MKIEVEKKDLDNLMISQIEDPITDETNIWYAIHTIENYVELYNEFNKLSILPNPASTIFTNLSKLLLKNENINTDSPTTNSNNSTRWLKLNTFTTGMLLMRNYITKLSNYGKDSFSYMLVHKKDKYMYDEILWIVFHGFLGGFMNPSEIALLLENAIMVNPNKFQSNADTYKGFEICPILKKYITVKNGSCEFIDKYKYFSSSKTNRIINNNCSSTNSQEQQPSKPTLITGASDMDYPIRPNYSTLPISFRQDANTAKNTNNALWYNNLILN